MALAGSANLDSRSQFLNYELMAAFHDVRDIARFSAWFDLERRVACLCDEQPPDLWRHFAVGLVLWIGFQILLAGYLMATDVTMRDAGAAASYEGSLRAQGPPRAGARRAGQLSALPHGTNLDQRLI